MTCCQLSGQAIIAKAKEAVKEATKMHGGLMNSSMCDLEELGRWRTLHFTEAFCILESTVCLSYTFSKQQEKGKWHKLFLMPVLISSDIIGWLLKKVFTVL